MEELTLRLAADTAATLQAEADERGVTVETHARDIIEAYRSRRDRRPTIRVDYMHDCQVKNEPERLDTDDTEEIGSFSYGSRSTPR